jgi:PAS domain S-box-containing protein
VSRLHTIIVEDSDDDAALIVLQLRRGGFDVSYERVQTGDALRAALVTRPPDVVICDYNLPSFSADDALGILRGSGLDVPFILVSGKVGEEVAANLMKAGANDFVLKHRLARLTPAVERELRDAEDRRQRRHAQAALHDSEQRFRLLAEHVQDVIFRYRLQPQPAVDYISPAVTTVIGRTPAELYAEPDLIFSAVDAEDLDRFRESWRSPHPPDLIARVHRTDGQLRWIEQRAVGVTDEHGRLVAIEGILRDVTEQTLAEQEHQRLDRELRQAERLDSLGQLAGGIAHDFNNLLAVIIGYASELSDGLVEHPTAHSDVALIRQAADKAAALTRQLLIFSKLEPSQVETLDLNGVVVEVERLLRRTIGEDIEFNTLLGPDLPPITIDRSKIEQVIVNLIMNARAAMPYGGQLRIHTTIQPDRPAVGVDRRIRLDVVDTGHGMTPDVAQRAFEPFFTTKGPQQGTGLGLATVYGAVTEAGGTVTLDSEPGRGTTVTVLLPAATQALTKPAKPESAAPAGAGQTILVVEDDDAVRHIVTRILTKASYHVLTAATPKEAIDVFTNGATHIDALLTDVVMPGMSGPQLVEHLRALRPDLPVQLMSGYTAGSFPGGAVPTDDLPLLRKPFTPPALLQQIRALLGH